MTFTIKVGVIQDELEKDKVFYQVKSIALANETELVNEGNVDFTPLSEFVNNHFTLEYADGKKETCILLNVGELEGVQCIYFENVEQYYKLSVL